MAKVTMPQLGESVAEGTIGKWLKQPGDNVAKYEPLLEVITDKVNAEVPSPVAGVLTEILVQEGETVPNNAEIAIIESADEAGARRRTAAAARGRARARGVDAGRRRAARPRPALPCGCRAAPTSPRPTDRPDPTSADRARRARPVMAAPRPPPLHRRPRPATPTRG